MEDSLSPGWAAFGRLQDLVANNRFADAEGFAREEALEDLAGEFQLGEPPADEVERRHRSLLRNRRRKHRVRKRLFDEQAAALAVDEAGGKSPYQQAADLDDIRWARERVEAPAWAVLVQLAEGESSEAVATAAGISSGALRVRLHRLRRQLRAVA